VITGANIIFLRKKFLKEIEKFASEKHKIISNSEIFTVSYTCSEVEVEEICAYLKQELIARRNEEFGRRQSCVGPHRDDIEFKINGLDAVKFASQGQQRTLVLALKLGELEIIKEKTGYAPILLLDDVLAELDETRQNYLLKSIEKDTQTIITSVDTLLFEEDFLRDVEIYSVENGRIKSNHQ
jgi:DNA replication and repair protein RecF